MGRVEAVCISEQKGERKQRLSSAVFVENHGIERDAHAGPWHRQVSLLAAEDVQAMKEKGLPDLKPGDFAENVLVTGVRLSELGLGSRLRLGETVELAITQRGKVCHTRCAIYEQTGDCMAVVCPFGAKLNCIQTLTASSGFTRIGVDARIQEAIDRTSRSARRDARIPLHDDRG